MSERNGGGPAFPKLEKLRGAGDFLDGAWDSFEADTTGGMSLRDHFAGLAMQSILSNRAVEEYRRQLDEMGVSDSKQQHAVAVTAYSQADAMLAAREEE